MIWNIKQPSRNDALTASVAFDISCACSEETGGMNSDGQLELARTVAFQASSEYDRSFVPSGYLALLAARALWAVGESQAARRLIARKRGDLNFSDTCANAVFLPDIPIRIWWRLCALHAVRPSYSAGAGRGEVWMLDMSRILVSERECLELTAFRATTAALDAMAPLWDRSKGRGALVLRRLETTVSFLLKSENTKKTGNLAAEIRKTCSAKFQSLRKTRCWESRPEIFSLDWRP